MIPLFSDGKQRNKNLECKLEQNSYGWCILKFKCQKTRAKLPVMFSNGTVLKESASTKKQGTVYGFSV